MRLERRLFQVDDVRFGERTTLDGRILVIKREELVSELMGIPGITAVDIELVHPGESARIIHLLDTVLPMVKVEGPGTAYPGQLSDPTLVGEGVTNVLSNVAVMECCLVPSKTTGLLHVREAICDMVGPAAEMHPFSHTHNVVLRLQVQEGKADPEYDVIVRQAGMKIAARLAEV
ncbi:MAG TPA: glycine reductase, partial [Firmicutes bacterium]|nr:glycine reductase [Bacillota bacterium]